MTLTELRELVASLLVDLDPDWTVHPAPVDALEPPAFMLSWSGDPSWLEPSTICTDLAQLDVIVVAPRLDVGVDTYSTLEAMVDAARAALAAAKIPVGTVRPPGPFEIAQTTYLAARLVVRTVVDRPGPVAAPTLEIAPPAPTPAGWRTFGRGTG